MWRRRGRKVIVWTVGGEQRCERFLPDVAAVVAERESHCADCSSRRRQRGGGAHGTMPIVAAVGREKGECKAMPIVATWRCGEWALRLARPERRTRAKAGQLSEKDSPWCSEEQS